MLSRLKYMDAQSQNIYNSHQILNVKAPVGMGVLIRVGPLSFSQPSVRSNSDLGEKGKACSWWSSSCERCCMAEVDMTKQFT